MPQRKVGRAGIVGVAGFGKKQRKETIPMRKRHKILSVFPLRHNCGFGVSTKGGTVVFAGPKLGSEDEPSILFWEKLKHHFPHRIKELKKRHSIDAAELIGTYIYGKSQERYDPDCTIRKELI